MANVELTNLVVVYTNVEVWIMVVTAFEIQPFKASLSLFPDISCVATVICLCSCDFGAELVETMAVPWKPWKPFGHSEGSWTGGFDRRSFRGVLRCICVTGEAMVIRGTTLMLSHLTVVYLYAKKEEREVAARSFAEGGGKPAVQGKRSC